MRLSCKNKVKSLFSDSNLQFSLRDLRMILSKWLLLTRLETRTKESTYYASVGVEKPKTHTERDLRCEARAATSTNRDSLKNDLSKSIIGRTRKMVNYGWVGWSQGKLWWRLEALLTCKSFVKLDCRGERLIEPSSSWFPLKFLSG